MLKLITYPAAFDLFAASPFCVKAAYLLNMSGLPWEREDTLDPRKAPYGKLPVLRTPDGLVPDSDGIRTYLEAQGACFDTGLSDVDKANARAFIRLAEEHFYFHLVYDRWANDDVWPTIRDVYFQQIPVFLRGFVAGSIRKNTLAGLHHHGVARYSEQDRLARLETDLEAVTTRLWHGKFLFGDTPTGADASLAPMLAAALATPVETPVKRLIAGNGVLTAYVERSETLMG
ncbi:MAG: glutathione S-transferase family protein [Roseobacter sp.]